MRRIARDLKRRIAYYRAIAAHSGTPRLSRWLLAAALAYALSPIDLIPDCIPVVGHLDDLLIVSGLILLALLLVPRSVREACRKATAGGQADREPSQASSTTTAVP